MRKVLAFLIIFFCRFVLWFRYRVRVEGLDQLNPEQMKNPGGVLFLPNHPSYFVDPLIVTLAVWMRYPIRPMIIEYMYYMPVVNWVMRFMNALPVPNFHSASNSVKRRRNEEVFQELMQGLRRGENFLVYPAGKVKYTAFESLAGASGVHRIIQEVPEANVVLVRTKGLWGSSFSRAIIKEPPTLTQAILFGIKTTFKNLLFFTPRRNVTICFEPAPKEFPYHANRIELNRFFEQWYNKPDGLTAAIEPYPGDSLVLVSYSMWGERYLPLNTDKFEQQQVELGEIDQKNKEKILQKLATMVDIPVEKINLEMSLTNDLGMDSLDQAELASFLYDEFDIAGVPVYEITTVKKLLAISTGKITFTQNFQDVEEDNSKWRQYLPHQLISLPEGETIPELFLKNCDRRGKQVACVDDMSGILTYQDLKMRVLLLVKFMRKLPGKYVGILLPASVGANVLTIAMQMAGKVPIMINWTLGPRHLEAVVKLSGVESVLTSWAFLDRLDNVDLTGIDDKLILLEELRREIKLTDKIKAKFNSMLSAERLIKRYCKEISADSEAVILFTSGTENMPKGVPLTHSNVLSNMRSIVKGVEFYHDDILFGILPPFHAFGFTVSGILSLLLGLRVAYFPNPTDGRRLSQGVKKWGVTVMCGAPTFLKGMVRTAKPGQLDSLRICATGAEKAPAELFEMFDKHGKKHTLIEGYGITECSPVLTFNREGLPHRGVGLPLPGIELKVIHPETQVSLDGEQSGLIIAHGKNIFKGYLNPGINSPFIEIENKLWYSTGDLGYIDSDGYLILEGRQKRFIKVGGEMVSLAAIEEALLNGLSTLGFQDDSGEGPLLAVCGKEIPGTKPKIVLFTRLDLPVDKANQILKNSGFSNLIKLTEAVKLRQIPIMGSGKIYYRLLESTHWPIEEPREERQVI